MTRVLCISAALAFACSNWLARPHEPAGNAVTRTQDAEFRALAKTQLPGDRVGERPYELVLAKRRPPAAPLVSFDALDQWRIEGRSGATAELAVSQKQPVWESPVARLTYKGASKQSELSLIPPQPVPIPEPSNAVTIWIYGNNWGWQPDPTTPPVDLFLLLQPRSGTVRELKLDTVRWKEWWLVHRVIPRELRELGPLSFAGLAIRNCGNKEERELFFEDLVFLQESPKPISFEPRPKRGIDPFPGQDPGANTGEGRLSFPNREETILPENLTRGFKIAVTRSANGFLLGYEGADCRVDYLVSPALPFFRDVRVRINGAEVATAWSRAGLEFGEEPASIDLLGFTEARGVITASWKVRLRGGETTVEMAARLWQKSLVVDTICRDGSAHALSYGAISGVARPELLLLPYINYGSHHLNVLISRGRVPFFASAWMDWYRSNASEPYATDKIEGTEVRLNGGVRYVAKTDGKRNPLFERVFVTFSPVFEETLPTIPNPPAFRGKEAGSRLWQESWGPQDYEKEHQRSKRLRAYGIDQLTQCNHEITWRDEGESFTFRTAAAPGKGGDDALRSYVERQKSLGWRSGLYTNYCDFSPVNAFWDPDMVMRNAAGDLVRAWPRCYSPKALFAVEMDRKLAPAIVEKFRSNAAYTDVHTSVSPWERCDYDARVPGAGTFAATFYAYGELLAHDQKIYDGFCWSEGHHQWLYAGLATGNYGLTYSDLKLWQYPYLPHFDLLKMHPLSVDIGMPWTEQFFHGNEVWSRKENIEKSIDQFIAATIAYGHIGWLVEEKHGMRQVCRSYYMLQDLQSRYAMERPVSIRYATARSPESSSAALLNGGWKEGRIQIQYANGLSVWVNGNAEKPWTVENRGSKYELPAYGWLAIQKDFLTGSLIADGHRFDRLSSPAYVFIDGRGTYKEFDGIGTSGSVAVRWAGSGAGLTIHTSGGADKITIRAVSNRFPPQDVRSAIAQLARARRLSVRSFDVDGKQLQDAELLPTVGGGVPSWAIQAHPEVVRYEVSTKALAGQSKKTDPARDGDTR